LSSAYIGSLFFYGFVIRLSEKVLEKLSSTVHCVGYECFDVAMTGNTDGFFDGF